VVRLFGCSGATLLLGSRMGAVVVVVVVFVALLDLGLIIGRNTRQLRKLHRGSLMALINLAGGRCLVIRVHRISSIGSNMALGIFLCKEATRARNDNKSSARSSTEESVKA
jgi:hypothetical protein